MKVSAGPRENIRVIGAASLIVTLLALVGAWLAIVVLAWSLCRAAQRGDMDGGADPQRDIPASIP